MSQQVQLSFRRPSPTPALIALLVLIAVGWLSMVVVAPWRALARESFLIDAATLPQLELWALLTHALLPTDFLSLLLDGLMLYLFGADLSREWGTLKWLTTLGIATLVGGALGALFAWLIGSSMLLSGPIAMVSACIAAYCWSVWNQRIHLFFIELTGKTMLLLFVALDFLFALFSLDPSHLAVQLGGMGVGLMMATSSWHPQYLKRHYHHWRIKRKLELVSRTPESDAKKRDPRRQRKDGTWIN